MNLIDLKKPLAFFDIESTGTDFVHDRIIEIAVVKILPDGNRDKFIQRINPEMHIPVEASAIHGIYDEDVAECPTFKEIAYKLDDFLENCDLAGYNSNKFDIPMLAEEMLRAGTEFSMSKRKFVDVQQIFFKKEQRTLAAALEFYCNKKLENAHQAENDVNATIDVFFAQLQKYDDLEKNVDYIHEYTGASQIVDFAQRIIKKNSQYYFNFGKHKGKLVTDVFEQEPQYYDWIMNADFSRNTKQVLSDIFRDYKLAKFKK